MLTAGIGARLAELAEAIPRKRAAYEQAALDALDTPEKAGDRMRLRREVQELEGERDDLLAAQRAAGARRQSSNAAEDRARRAAAFETARVQLAIGQKAAADVDEMIAAILAMCARGIEAQNTLRSAVYPILYRDRGVGGGIPGAVETSTQDTPLHKVAAALHEFRFGTHFGRDAATLAPRSLAVLEQALNITPREDAA